MRTSLAMAATVLIATSSARADWVVHSFAQHFRMPVENLAALPGAENGIGDVRLVLDVNRLYSWDGDSWSPTVSATDDVVCSGCVDASDVAADVATQAELDAFDASADDLSDNEVGDLSDVSEAGAGAGEALVSDGAGSWSPSVAAAILEGDSRLTDARDPTAHAASHAENASDELLAEALGTACGSGVPIEGDGSGGLACGTDDTGGSPAGSSGALQASNGAGGLADSGLAGAAGGLVATGTIQAGNGSASTPGLRFSDGSGLYIQSANILSISLAGVRKFQLRLDGANATFQATNNIAGDGLCADSTGYACLKLSASSGPTLGTGPVTVQDILKITPKATAPATCAIGDFYVDTSGAACACSATNTWSNMHATGSCA